LNYAEVPPAIQEIRGNHVTLREAEAALAEHTGIAPADSGQRVMRGAPDAGWTASASGRSRRGGLPSLRLGSRA
jgi:hypothetical protein